MAAEPTTDPSAPHITATQNGPYQVDGIRRIVWREPVESKLGEPIAWRTRDVVVEGDQTYWLCRCGNSNNKPFCDGSHRTSGFVSADPADVAPRSERTKTYQGEEVVVVDDRSLCMHASFCGTKTSNVWKMTKDTASTETRSLLVAMVQRCPSGALSVRTETAGEDLEPALATEVALVPDGPLWVTGGVPVTKSDGNDLEVRNRVTLCRCGASKTKPLCDGSHAEAGFQHRPQQLPR